ncbi:MAG: hypothetical protein WCC29_04910 [Pseudomonas farsensis]|uniref:hypothetical protein n=1 Tax=Pseudomonas farsensis TaxID=2745492 RepID=UPI003C7BC967
MAKPVKGPDETKKAVGETITFVDQDYERRKLFLPNWVVLEVVRGVVHIRSDNQLALDYMRNRPDFKEQEPSP